MKNTFFITIIMIACCVTRGYDQGLQIYPIPSINIAVNGFANFRQNSLSQALVNPAEKRDVDVEVSTPSPSISTDCQATVWVYTLDNQTVLGPFTVDCNEPLQVGIDDRLWGVLIETNEELLVSVWIN
jgi:hypothetical protein